MALDEDAFETVAITWSQPEAAVMLSMFEFYGIPAFAVGRLHASIIPNYITALQGMQVRVPVGAVDDALDLLAEVAERPAAVRPYMLGHTWFYPALVAFALAALVPLYLVDEPSPLLLALTLPAIFLFTGIPPTRTPSTFMLWKRSRDPLNRSAPPSRHRPAGSRR
jgi:hypothetical protein